MRNLIHRTFLTMFAAVVIPSAATAVTHTWRDNSPGRPPTATENSMANPANWVGGVPVSGSPELTLDFPGHFTSYSPAQDIVDILSVQRLQFGSGFGGSYNMTGGAYQMDNLGAPPSIAVSSGAQFHSPVIFNAPTTVTAGTIGFAHLSGGDASFSGDPNLSTTIFLFGPEPNTLTGTYTFANRMTVFLNKPSDVAALGGNVVLTGSSPAQQIFLIAGNANQFAPGTNIAATNGVFQWINSQTVNDVTLGAASEVSLGAGSTATVQGNITHTGGLAQLGDGQGTIDFDGQLKTINTSVAGAGNDLQILSPIVNGRFNKTGPGTLRIANAANSFTGQNVVSGGTLIGNADTIGANVLNNATIELDSGTLSGNVISGAGNVRIRNITFGAAQSYTGGTEVLSRATGQASTLSGDFISTTAGELRFIQDVDGTFNGNLAGNLKVAKQGSGVLSIGGVSTNNGVISIQSGGLHFLTDSAVGTGNLVINSPSVVTIAATGHRTLANAPQFMTSTTFVGSGDLTFTDSSPKTLHADIVHNSSGTTQIDGKFALAPTASIAVNNGHLVLGDPTQIGGFAAAGPIVLTGGTLTARSLNFTTLSDVTVAGGTLDAPSGYAIPLSAALQGFGGVTGRVASANGSSIIARGNLTLGDAAHSAGVNLDGELFTGANTVTLADSNQAVLGSFTDVGTANDDGTLISPNGYVLNFGRNIVGRGRIESNNAIADATIINGDVNGDSAANHLEFTGYVKGVGTFNNVAFSGTFSPGLSPTLSTVGAVILTPSNVLEMEIGGRSRGSQYDAFDVTGSIELGGELRISLIDGFTPSLGDRFDLFDGRQTGAFARLDLPQLSSVLRWDASELYSNGVLLVAAVPEPASSGLAAMLLYALKACKRGRPFYALRTR